MTENVQGIGARLTRAREAKKLTVTDVADKLKLTVRQVEAMESEDFDRLPGPVFVRGFLRNYARLVGVSMEHLPNAGEAVIQPAESIAVHSEEVVISTSPVRRWLLLPAAGLVLFVILVALLYNWLKQGGEAYLPMMTTPSATQMHSVPVQPLPPSQPGQTVPANGTPIPLTVNPLPPAQEATSPDPAKPAPSDPPAAAQPATSGAVSVPQPLQLPSAQTDPPTQFQFGGSTVAGHVARLTANDESSWIQVATGDGKHYSQLLKPGETMTVHAIAPVQLVVGNGAHASLAYDGKQVDLKPYIGEKVARLTLK